MFAHMLCDAVDVLKETYMAELVYLIMTNGLNL